MIIPKNWALFAVNFFLGICGTTQLVRIWRLVITSSVLRSALFTTINQYTQETSLVVRLSCKDFEFNDLEFNKLVTDIIFLNALKLTK